MTGLSAAVEDCARPGTLICKRPLLDSSRRQPMHEPPNGDLQPTVQGVLQQFSRRKQNFVGFPIPGGEGQRIEHSLDELQVVSLDVSWEIDLWGRLRRRGVGRRSPILQASAADLRGAQLSIAGQTVKEHGWPSPKLNSRSIWHEQTVESFRVSARPGPSNGSKRESAPHWTYDWPCSTSQTLEALLQQRLQQFDAASRQLEVLRRRVCRRRDRTRPRHLPANHPEQCRSGLPSELVARRPDLVAAERDALGGPGSRRADVSRAELLPRISLTGRYRDGDGRICGRLSMVISACGVWSAISWQPLWDGADACALRSAGLMHVGAEVAR